MSDGEQPGRKWTRCSEQSNNRREAEDEHGFVWDAEMRVVCSHTQQYTTDQFTVLLFLMCVGTGGT